MSLTGFLDIPHVRELFSETIIKPKFTNDKPIVFSPLTKHNTVIGIAFDYLMRLFIKGLNHNVIEHQWIAESLLTNINSPILQNISIDGDKKVVIGYKETDLTKFLKKCITDCKILSSKYLQSFIISDDLIISFILLSQFDPIYRSGKIFDINYEVDKNDIIDLRNLLTLVEENKSKFISKNYCILDATFGEASHIIGGADVDLIIDNKIIDIKTTVKCDMNRDVFNQIFGYYLLSRIGKIDGLDKVVQIDTICIYYSRFGLLSEIPISKIADENKIADFTDQFFKEVKNTFRKPN